uniref:Uncharacterized protein n=1 Tax=Mus musculus TaxID=10090 RepID=Q3TZX5_MOUSE|nr:unnamed protein product [Mus musculus]
MFPTFWTFHGVLSSSTTIIHNHGLAALCSLLAVLGYPGSNEVHTDNTFFTVQKSLLVSGREGKTLFLHQKTIADRSQQTMIC